MRYPWNQKTTKIFQKTAVSTSSFVEEKIGYPITLISNGPERHDIIRRGFED